MPIGKTEIVRALRAAGIEFPVNSTKADLMPLYNALPEQAAAAIEDADDSFDDSVGAVNPSQVSAAAEHAVLPLPAGPAEGRNSPLIASASLPPATQRSQENNNVPVVDRVHCWTAEMEREERADRL